MPEYRTAVRHEPVLDRHGRVIRFTTDYRVSPITPATGSVTASDRIYRIAKDGSLRYAAPKAKAPESAEQARCRSRIEREIRRSENRSSYANREGRRWRRRLYLGPRAQARRERVEWARSLWSQGRAS